MGPMWSGAHPRRNDPRSQREPGHSDDRVIIGNIRLSDLKFRILGYNRLQVRQIHVYISNGIKWTLTLREEQRLRVFENKVVRKIFGAKRDEVTGEWRKLHNAELQALYTSPDIIRNIKSRRLRWAGHVARMGESRNAYRVLVGRPERKRPLGRLRRRWENNIKINLREVGYDCRDWINLAQDRDRWWAYMRAGMNLRMVFFDCYVVTFDLPMPHLRRQIRKVLNRQSVAPSSLNLLIALCEDKIQEALVTHASSSDKIQEELVTHAPSSDKIQGELITHAPSLDKIQKELVTHAPSSDKIQEELVTHAPLSDKIQAELVTHASSSDKIQKELVTHASSSDKIQEELVTHAPSSDKIQKELVTHASSSDKIQEELVTHAPLSDKIQEELVTHAFSLDRIQEELTEPITHASSSDKIQEEPITRAPSSGKTHAPSSDKIQEELVNHAPSSNKIQGELINHAPSSNKIQEELVTHTPLSDEIQEELVTHIPLSDKIQEELVTHAPSDKIQEELIAHALSSDRIWEEVVAHVASSSDRIWEEMVAHAPSSDKIQEELIAHAPSSDKIQEGMVTHAPSSDKVQEELVTHAASDKIQEELIAHAPFSDKIWEEVVAHAPSSDKIQEASAAQATPLNVAATESDQVEKEVCRRRKKRSLSVVRSRKRNRSRSNSLGNTRSSSLDNPRMKRARSASVTSMNKRYSLDPVPGRRSPICTRSRTEKECLNLRRINGRRRLFPSAVPPHSVLLLQNSTNKINVDEKVTNSPEKSASSGGEKKSDSVCTGIPVDGGVSSSEGSAAAVSRSEREVIVAAEVIGCVGDATLDNTKMPAVGQSGVEMVDNSRPEHGTRENGFAEGEIHSVGRENVDVSITGDCFQCVESSKKVSPQKRKNKLISSNIRSFMRPYSTVITRSKSRPILRSKIFSRPSQLYVYPKLSHQTRFRRKNKNRQKHRSRREIFVNSKVAKKVVERKVLTARQSRSRSVASSPVKCGSPQKQKSRSFSCSEILGASALEVAGGSLISLRKCRSPRESVSEVSGTKGASVKLCVRAMPSTSLRRRLTWVTCPSRVGSWTSMKQSVNAGRCFRMILW
ncbi:hypothetical protein ANN_03858 [Periplaneta americana]|uniref:Uncharacterized protein n=1 Tax=Periplaneta americana TaxID=6978 RepID=A0ABQ8U1H4_PERAM|nr:hypothetical protein ANN_03858 [Periplaneta americana]